MLETTNLNPNLVRVKIANDIFSINAMRHLLYQVYIEEQKWDFSPENPSGIRIDSSNPHFKMLVDDRDYQAVWFGAYYQDKLVGCGRACGRNHKGQFEVQAYQTGKNFDGLLSSTVNPKLVELTRGAVSKEYRSIGILPMTLYFILDYCSKNNLSAFAAPSLNKVISFYKSISFPSIPDFHFKFEPQDATEAQFFFASFEKGEIDTMLKNVSAQITLIKENYFNKQKLISNLANKNSIYFPMNPKKNKNFMLESEKNLTEKSYHSIFNAKL